RGRGCTFQCAGRCVRSGLAEVRFVWRWGGPERAGLAHLHVVGPVRKRAKYAEPALELPKKECTRSPEWLRCPQLRRHAGELGMSDDNPSTADPFGPIADEFVAALRQGQRPSVEEFARRYPEHADVIRDMLPALALMEQAKATDDIPGQGRS